MNKPSKFPEIRKEAFVKARESLGLTTKELAAKACLSNRQIEQIENGEMGSFYSAHIKYTAAKKVSSILQLTEDQAFDSGAVTAVAKAATLVEETPPVPTKLEEKPPKKVKPTETPAIITQPQLVSELQAVVEKNSNKPSAKSDPQKKLILLLCLAAAAIFSVINLRPLFFSEQVKEEPVISQETAPVEAPPENTPPVIEEKTSSPAPAVVAASAVTTDCPAAESAPTTYKTDAPKKAGDMVFLQSKSAQMVCVIDALGKVQNKLLEPGVGVSVYGKAPLKVLTAGLDQVDLYYQGSKVRPANPSGKTIVLESAEFTQPLTPFDSQLR